MALARSSPRFGFESWPGTFCCVLGQDTLLSQCLSPSGCINEYRELNAGGGRGGSPAMDQEPIHGGVEILLVASCYRNRDKLRPDGSLDSYEDVTDPHFPLLAPRIKSFSDNSTTYHRH